MDHSVEDDLRRFGVAVSQLSVGRKNRRESLENRRESLSDYLLFFVFVSPSNFLFSLLPFSWYNGQKDYVKPKRLFKSTQPISLTKNNYKIPQT